MDVTVHLTRPLQESPEVAALPPGELPELQKADLLHFDPTIGLDSPEKIRATPGSEAVSAGRIPEKAENVAHRCSASIT